jgi:hypothetical protein
VTVRNSEGKEAKMENNEIRFKVTLELDAKWASNQSSEELAQYIQERLNSSLGFRGQVKKFKIVSR